MNHAQVVRSDGTIDPELAQSMSGGLSMILEEVERPALQVPTFLATITVREWDARHHRHNTVYVGQLNYKHVRTLAVDRCGLPSG